MKRVVSCGQQGNKKIKRTAAVINSYHRYHPCATKTIQIPDNLWLKTNSQFYPESIKPAAKQQNAT